MLRSSPGTGWATSRQLAHQYDVSGANVEDLLPRYGIVTRKRPLTPGQIDKAIRLTVEARPLVRSLTCSAWVQSTVWAALKPSR
jgi:hypothetical protein